MVALTILAGGFVNFIATYLFDPDAKSLTLVRQTPTGPSPSWIEKYAVNPSFLVATSEVDAGLLQTFTIQPDGTLGPISNISTSGNGPTHILTTTNGTVSAMNFGSGSGAIFQADPSLNFVQGDIITFPVVGQSGVSNPHQTVQYGDELLVPDLGGDTIWRLTKTCGHWSIKGEIQQKAGSGPRHATISGDLLFTLHEKDNTLTAQEIPPLGITNVTSFISVETIIPTDRPFKPADFAAGELLLPGVSPGSDFAKPFLYASNRFIGTTPDPRGDSIAIFSFDCHGTLKLVNQAFTGLFNIRGMQFGGPDNRYLVASGVSQAGGVVVFERTEGGANLMEVARNTQIPNLATFVWL